MTTRPAIAVVDIGTNTTLLLVARPGATAAEVEVLDEAAEITRLGRGIGKPQTPGWRQEGIARTLEVLRRYAALAARHDAPIAALGTEALRRAPNAADFLSPAAEILGVPIEVIGGDREAALTFRAIAESFPAEVSRRTPRRHRHRRRLDGDHRVREGHDAPPPRAFPWARCACTSAYSTTIRRPPTRSRRWRARWWRCWPTPRPAARDAPNMMAASRAP